MKYADERERNIIIAIADDPIAAFTYGEKFNGKVNSFTMKNNQYWKATGFKSFYLSRIYPHTSLFTSTGGGRYENISADGITTEIFFQLPHYNKENREIVTYTEYKKWMDENQNKQETVESKPNRKDYKNSMEYMKVLGKYNKNKKAKLLAPIINSEDQAKMHNFIVGEVNDDGSNGDIYIHKKDVNRATVCGVKGFVGTLIWEDDYQYTITDNYGAFDSTIGNGVNYTFKVRTYGDKDEVTFEQIEGRRYYLKRLISKIVSSTVYSNHKY